MKVLSWVAVFIVALFVALVLVLTFTQPEFKTTVGAQLLTYKTRQLPVYLYVAGAFAVGLLIGIFQALFTFIRLKAELFRKNRVVHELEQKLALAEQRVVEETEAAHGEKGSITSMSANSEKQE